MNITPLFPHIASDFILSEDTSELFDYVKQTEYKATVPSIYSQQNTRVSTNYHILSEFPAIRQQLLYQFNTLNIEVLKYHTTTFDISSSWATKTEMGGVCDYHYHSNCYYSGVLYFEDGAEGDGHLHITAPKLNSSFMLYRNPSDDTSYNSIGYGIKSEKNLVIFFPSYLQHKITKHTNQRPRYSLAFNIIPVGTYGFSDSMVTLNQASKI